MINAAEKLYGPYQWEQYDILVLPYSFPFGGMENPMLTFANPTLLAGDKSLVSVIAHELAHSWSGNLVTNRTWNDFWLNEGFTVYFEQRIMESIYGKEVADILALIEFDELKDELKRIKASENPEDSKLHLALEGRNPDDGMTDIAYVKGAFFLALIDRCKALGISKWVGVVPGADVQAAVGTKLHRARMVATLLALLEVLHQKLLALEIQSAIGSDRKSADVLS
jgi:aminopeptidase N